MTDEKLYELKEEIGERIGICQEFYTNQYNHSEYLKKFVSGVQHTDDEISERDSNNRPPLEVLNVTKKYVNAVTNIVRQSPNGIIVNVDEPSISKALSDEIHTIESLSNADEVYETAFTDAVESGFGFIIVTTDYKDNESLDQVPKLEAVTDQFQCYLDPNHEFIDGSDAKYGFYLKYYEEEYIEDTYGEDYVTDSTSLRSGMYKKCKGIPSDSVPVLTYFTLKTKMIKRWFFQDGSFIDQREKPELPVIGSRQIEKKSVLVYKFIGEELVDESELFIDSIPIVPVYGDRVFRGDGVRWVGLTEQLLSSQRMINRYHNREIEISENTPITPLITTKKAIKGFEQQFRNMNKVAYATLVINDGEQMPTRLDNNANTADSINGKNASLATAESVTGIYQNQLGANQTENAQSGTAISLLQGFGERNSAHYYQNLAKSIQQVGKIILQLINQTNPQLGEMIDSYGYNKIKVDVSVGAILESNKQRDLRALQAIQSLLPDDKKTALLDIIVNQVESKDSEIIKSRVKKLIPVEFQDNQQGIDPKAMEALNSANQAIQASEAQNEQLKQYITQLQNQLIAIQNDSEAMLMKAKMDNDNDLQIALIKEQGNNERTMAKIIADQDAKFEKMLSKFKSDIAEFIPKQVYDESKIKSDLTGRQFD